MSLISPSRVRPAAWTPDDSRCCSGVSDGAEQQVVEADHAVERRPDLVAHGGQEVRLLARGLHRLVAGSGHLGLRPLALGDPGQLLGDPPGHGLDQLVAEQRGSGGDRDDGVHLGAEQDRERDGQPRLVPDRPARVVGALGQHELRGGPRVADVLRRGRRRPGRRARPGRAVRDGHEGPRPLPVVVQQHQGPGLHEHLAERGRLVGGTGDRLHEVVLGDLVLQGVLAGLQRGDQLVPLGVVGVAVQQGPRPARVVEQGGLAAQHPLDRAVAAHPLHLDRMLVDPALADAVEVRAELRAAVLVQDVEDGQRGQSLVSDPVQPRDLRVGVHRPTVQVDDPQAIRRALDDVPVELREVHVPPPLD